MAEETSTTETTVKTSSGSVKIAVEEYNDLMRRANEPKQVYNPVYNTVEKTPAMVAADNKMWGSIFMGGGASMFVIGALQFVKGVKQAKALL